MKYSDNLFTDFTETFELLKNFMSKCYTLGNFDGSTTLLAYILNIYYPHSTFSEEEGSFDESQWEQNNLLDNTT